MRYRIVFGVVLFNYSLVREGGSDNKCQKPTRRHRSTAQDRDISRPVSNILNETIDIILTKWTHPLPQFGQNSVFFFYFSSQPIYLHEKQ